ncbi:MAG: P-loop NTPase [Candidatus Latescibacterota bacterium]
MAQYEVTLRDYWRILRRRRTIVGITGLLLGFFSLVLALVWEPEPLYRAGAKVQIAPSQTLTGLYLDAISYNAGDQMETQRAIIVSYPVLRRTAEELHLVAGGDTARTVLGLQERVATRQEGYTNIIVVEATHPRPETARDLANTVARAYQGHSHDQRNQQAAKHRSFVEAQREKARAALQEAEEAVRRYREEADLVSLDAQARVMLDQITQTEQDFDRLEQTLRDVDAILAEIPKGGGLSERTMQGASRLQVGETFMSLTQQLNLLRLDRDALLVQFTPDHPRVAELQAKLDQLSRSLVDELRQRRQAVQRELEGTSARLDELRAAYKELPSRGLRLSRLEREVDLRQSVVSVLEEEYQNALIREADKVEEVTVLQWAITPTRPVNPNHPVQRGLLGLVLGLVLGVVFAVVAETLDTSIGTIEDVQEYTGAQVVGLVPFIDLDEVAASLRRHGQAVADRRALQRKAQLVSCFDPQSTLAETFRTLRTNIEFVTVEKGARTLMVTSSTMGEGKSTVAANLAMTMAQLGKRTLLVDCDLRKPSLARLFGLDREPGLAEVIVGNYRWNDVVRTVTDFVTGGMGMEDVLQTQGISNLHIVTSGAIPPNPSELLNSRRMGEFLAQVGEAYDVVLLDSPPVLHVTDAVILGKKVDGSLIVYKAGDIPRTSLRRAISLLRSVEVELLGVVLNGIHANISSDYQDFGYARYYAYGSRDEEAPRTWGGRARRRLARILGTRRARRREPLEEEEAEPAPPEESPAPPAEAGSARRGLGRASSALLLAAVLLGLAWQSGWLTRPLGLVPVLSVCRETGWFARPPTVAGP